MYSDHPKLVTQMDNPCNPFLDLCMDDLVGNGKLIAIAIAGSNFGTLLWEEMAVLTHFICKMYLSVWSVFTYFQPPTLATMSKKLTHCVCFLQKNALILVK